MWVLLQTEFPPLPPTLHFLPPLLAWWGQQVTATCKDFGGDGDQALRIACVHGEALRSRGGKHAQKEKVVALGREKAELIKLLI